MTHFTSLSRRDFVRTAGVGLMTLALPATAVAAPRPEAALAASHLLIVEGLTATINETEPFQLPQDDRAAAIAGFVEESREWTDEVTSYIRAVLEAATGTRTPQNFAAVTSAERRKTVRAALKGDRPYRDVTIGYLAERATYLAARILRPDFPSIAPRPI